jgi:alkylated DNA repair dioxygenase AlkB
VKRQQAELFGDLREDYGALPEGFVFQPDFIGPDEEQALLDAISRLALEEAKYKQYTARRRIAYFGFGYDFSANRLGEAPPAPAFLEPLRDKVAAWMGLAPQALEQALVTEYRPGTPLGWHRDAPDFGRVAGVSLGGWARMRLRRYPRGKDEPIVLDHLSHAGPAGLALATRWGWRSPSPQAAARRNRSRSTPPPLICSRNAAWCCRGSRRSSVSS